MKNRYPSKSKKGGSRRDPVVVNLIRTRIGYKAVEVSEPVTTIEPSRGRYVPQGAAAPGPPTRDASRTSTCRATGGQCDSSSVPCY